MPVYVDNYNFPKWGKHWCHMDADTNEELHAMADKIGLKREWFQTGPTKGHEHYDITLPKRALAVKFGAIEIDLNTREGKMHVVNMNKKYREELTLKNGK
jgi:hypothetical protein